MSAFRGTIPAAVLVIFLCLPVAAFAGPKAVIGGEDIVFPDLQGYHIHLPNTSQLFAKVKDCVSTCGSMDNALAVYLPEAYDGDRKIENCLEIDMILVKNGGLAAGQDADNSALLDHIQADFTSGTAKKNLSAGFITCTNLLSARSGGIFKPRSLEIVDISRGDNYVILITKSQVDKSSQGEWKSHTFYDALAHVMIKGKLLIIDCSDTTKQVSPAIAKKVALNIVNVLTAANK